MRAGILCMLFSAGQLQSSTVRQVPMGHGANALPRAMTTL
eukprot:COSAG02_NODE_12970_length_1466_cov_1.441112_2_plen_39_part_01